MDFNKILEKLETRLQAGKIQILSEIEITDEEYTYLIDYTKIKLEYLGISTITSYDIPLSVAMVQIGIHSYFEGNYWDYFDNTLGFSLNAAKHCYIGQIFLSTLEKFDLFIYKEEENHSNKYVQNILMHGFVPNNYLMEYFDFAYSFYERNLFRQLPEDLEEEYDELRTYMISTLRFEKDNISLREIGKRPSKSYRLLKCTRTLFADENLTSVKTIFKKSLSLIDKYYYDSVLPKDNTRISNEFINWIKNQKEFHYNVNRKRSTHSSTRLISNSPYLKLNFDKKCVDLIIPEQKFRESEFNNKIIATINANYLKENVELEVYSAFGTIATEKLKHNLTGNCFSLIEIFISSGTSKNYKIKEQQYRIFDENGDEISVLQIGKNYLYVEKGISLKPGDKKSIIDSILFTEGRVYQILVNQDSVFYVENLPITILGEFSEGPKFTKIIQDYQLKDVNGEVIYACSAHPVVSFKVAKEKKKGAAIWINGRRINAIVKGTTTEVDIKNDSKNIGLNIIIDNLVLEEEKTFEIILDIPGEHKKTICKYVLIKNLKCETDKNRYIFNKNAEVIIKGNYNIVPLNSELVDRGHFRYSITNTESNNADFIITLDKEYFLHVPIKTLRWKFGGNEWSCTKPKYFWVDRLVNDFYLDIPFAVETSIYLNKNNENKFLGENISNNIFRFNIGELVNEIRTSHESWHYLNAIFKDSKYKMPILRILKTIWIYDFNLVLGGENIFCCIASFDGDAKLLAIIKNSATQKILYNEIEIQNGINSLEKLKKDDLYSIELFMVYEDEFGLSNYKKEINTIHKIGVIDYENISNCKILIKNIYFQEEKLVLNFQYIIRDVIKIEDHKYSGKVTEVTKVNEINKYKKEEIKFTLVIIDTMFFEPDKLKIFIKLKDHSKDTHFVYDKKLKNIISAEDEILLLSKDIDRYIYLYEDLVEYDVEYRRVK